MSDLERQPRFGIIMGSDSDLRIMRHVGKALTTLGLRELHDYEERVVSAHRTPKWMRQYADEAEQRGVKVIIAGAGGSAHLPGMVASETVLPVLGVAITDNPDVMNRALGSMIGMPKGKPLATFQGEAGAFNAGLLAARIVALGDPALRGALVAYDASLEDEVLGKDERLHELGATAYLAAVTAEPKPAESDYYF